MATTDFITENHDDRAHRRRPFSTWVKKLTSFKNSSDNDRTKRYNKVKRGQKLNNPYPESGVVSRNHGQHLAQSVTSFGTQQTGFQSVGQSTRYSVEDLVPPTTGGRSIAGTFSSEGERPVSLTAPSHGASSLTGTARTLGGGLDSRHGGDSTFSSPAPSVRSLATTLTTIQSIAPNGPPAASSQNTHSVQFSQPFPTTSPASAVPPHLVPTTHPTTYNSATANNLLTDNASILTLASSSKRRRRRSMDTDASVRALAPSSLWGGSRESLPLSVLSSNIEATTPGIQSNASRLGMERSSIYSTTGVTPALPSERNSLYTKQVQGDGASIRSGFHGHGRPGSISGSLAGVTGTLASPREAHDEKQLGESSQGDNL